MTLKLILTFFLKQKGIRNLRMKFGRRRPNFTSSLTRQEISFRIGESEKKNSHTKNKSQIRYKTK